MMNSSRSSSLSSYITSRCRPSIKGGEHQEETETTDSSTSRHSQYGVVGPLDASFVHDFSGEANETISVRDGDVISGRGKLAFHHAGNVRFRELVADSVESYKLAEKRLGKPLVVQSIIDTVHAEGARFLRRGPKLGKWVLLDAQQQKDKVSHAIRDASKEVNRKNSGGTLGGNSGSEKESGDDQMRPPCPRGGMTERTVGRAASTSRLSVDKARPEPIPSCHPPIRAASTTNIYANLNQSEIGSSSLFENSAAPQGNMVGGRHALASFPNEPIRPPHPEMERIVPHAIMHHNYDAIARESEQDPVGYLQELARNDAAASASKRTKAEARFLDSFGSSMTLDSYSRCPNDLNQFSCGSMDFMESSDSSNRSRDSYPGNSSSRYMLPPGLSMLSAQNNAVPQHNVVDDTLTSLEMSVASLDISTSDMSNNLQVMSDVSHDLSSIFDPQQPQQQRLGVSTIRFSKADKGDERQDSWGNLRSSITSHNSQMTSKAGNLSHRVW